MNDNLHLDGAKEFYDAMDSLSPKVKAQVLRSFLRKAATKEVIKPVRQGLPYSRNTTKNIKITTSRRDRNKTAILAGPTYDSFWLRFTEKGTKPRYTKKGAFRGQLVGKNKLEPLMDSRIDDVVKFVNEELGNEIDSILNKKLKRLNKK